MAKRLTKAERLEVAEMRAAGIKTAEVATADDNDAIYWPESAAKFYFRQTFPNDFRSSEDLGYRAFCDAFAEWVHDTYDQAIEEAAR